MFDTTLLNTYVAVAKNRSFTRAAQALNLTQATISAQIARLEEQLDCSLFQRTTRVVKLTTQGETLLGYALAMLELQQQAQQSIAGKTHTQTVRIGVAEDIAESFLPKVLQQLTTEHPLVQIDITVGMTKHLVEEANRSNIDIVLGCRCEHEHYGTILWRDTLIWAAASNMLPLRHQCLPLAFFPEPCPYRAAALRSLQQAGFQWRIACISPSASGIRAATLAGLAITPMPRGTLPEGLIEVNPELGLPTMPTMDFILYSPVNSPLNTALKTDIIAAHKHLNIEPATTP